VGKGDLAYVACILRLVDYAHINRDRAPTLERALRQPLEPESLLHWLAQEKIDGPERDGSELVYRSSSPIQDVDAWWLYFEMLNGLDKEISAVRRYLDHRPSSKGRLSLERVRGASSPQDAAIFIQTSGFVPIEVNIRAGSIDRLVKLLGGETLYGAEPMAAVRELIQNARDAVMLKAAVAESDFERASFTLPITVKLDTKEPASLEMIDYGVGMSRRVMTDYLVSIASDYWTSEQFFTDFPSALDRGFKPAGKFGIGFVSVFMLGDQVQVESNRDGGERLRLTLRGVGRQGELRALPAPPGSGTSVKIRLNQEAVGRLKEFPELCKAYAPMLLHDLRVEIDGIATEIKKVWWKELDTDTFAAWALEAGQRLLRAGSTETISADAIWSFRRLRRGIPGEDSRPSWPNKWPEWLSDGCRLVAHPRYNTSFICLKGLALTTVHTPGFIDCSILRPLFRT
jgi:hypothetical protein